MRDDRVGERGEVSAVTEHLRVEAGGDSCLAMAFVARLAVETAAQRREWLEAEEPLTGEGVSAEAGHRALHLGGQLGIVAVGPQLARQGILVELPLDLPAA